MLDVMLDLETMGTGPGAAIVAIGAVAFNVPTRSICQRFYRPVDLTSSARMGGQIDPATVLWWMQQGDLARAAFAKGGDNLSKVLLDFSAWMATIGPADKICMWGNGAGFDNVILASAYKAVMLDQPWSHWNDRCYRTVRAMHPEIKLERIGVHHNACDDAESQAMHLMMMLNSSAAVA